MRIISIATAVLSSLVLFSGPAIAGKPAMTPLEIQALQSKEFGASKEDTFSAVLSVFQDLGYQVDTADVNSGFITASSATVAKTSFFEAMAGVTASGNTKATATIQKMPDGQTKVRLNFLNKRSESSRYGQQYQNDAQILDPKIYESAWDKIDESLFTSGALKKTDTSGTAAASASATSAQ